MSQPSARRIWINWAGSASIIALIAVFGSAQAQQAGRHQGGMVQKGRETQAAPPQDSVIGAGQISAITGGAVAGIVVARPEHTACDNGSATACRSIEAGLSTGGAWAFIDGGITAVDDWEAQSARQAAPTSPPSPAQRQQSVHSALAACDARNAAACRAFAASVRPATTAERSERRTYTAGW